MVQFIFCQASLFSFQSPSFGVSFFRQFLASPFLGGSHNLSLSEISGVSLFRHFGFWVFLHIFLAFWIPPLLFSIFRRLLPRICFRIGFFFQKDAPRRLSSPLGIHETARHRFSLDLFVAFFSVHPISLMCHAELANPLLLPFNAHQSVLSTRILVLSAHQFYDAFAS